MSQFSGKTVLVTGGSHGIGREIVMAFAREGANVVINYLSDYDLVRSLNNVSKLKDELSVFDCRVVTLSADVSDESNVISMFDQIRGEFGGVDILINNAGFVSLSTVEDMTLEEWDRMIAVHLRGTFLVTRAALPYMLAQNYGRIINMASQIGQIGRSEYSHYAAAKAGIIAFTKSLAREVSTKGVNVNCIAPGPILTGIVPVIPGRSEPNYAVSLPLGRAGIAFEVAPTALFLAGTSGDLYVGQTLGPNSGDVML
jgi:3-oxoacyl-[acyl-carrier protein] reductase